MADPYQSDVKLLFHFDGANGSSAEGLVDETGTVTLETWNAGEAGPALTTQIAFSNTNKFGGGSLKFTGAAVEQYALAGLDIPASPTASFGTLEFWFRVSGTAADDGMTPLFCIQDNNGWVPFKVAFDANNLILNDSGDVLGGVTYGTSVAQSVWHHFAVQATGTVLEVWLDGALVYYDDDNGSFAYADLGVIPSGTLNLYFGYDVWADYIPDSGLSVRIDEIRYTANVRRYDSVGNTVTTYTVPTDAFEYVAPISGTLDAALPAMTGDSIGTLVNTVDVVLPLMEGFSADAAYEASAGKYIVATLPIMMAEMIGQPTLDATLPTIRGLATNATIPTGTLIVNLPNLTSKLWQAYSFQTLPVMTVSMLATTHVAEITSTLPRPTSTIVAQSGYLASLNQSLPSITSNVVGGHYQIKSALPLPISTITALVGRTGALHTELPALIGTGSAVAGRMAQIVAVLPTVLASSFTRQENILDGALPTLTNESSAIVGSSSDIATSLPLVQTAISAMLGTSGDAHSTLPALRSDIDALPTKTTAVALTLPSLTASFVAGAVSPAQIVAVLHKPTSSLFAITGPLGGILAVVPSLTGSLASTTMYGSMSAALPTIQGLITRNAIEGALLPALSAAIDVVVGISTAANNANAADGSDAIKLPALTSSISATVGVLGRVTPAFSAMTSSINALMGVTGGVSVTLMPLTLNTVTAGSAGASEIVARLYRMRAQLTGMIDRDVGLTHVANTLTNAVTTFDGYNFTSFAEFNGAYYAAGPDGLFQLDVHDSAEPVVGIITTGSTDFGSPQLKRASDFYLALRSASDVTLRVTTDELDPYEYVISSDLPTLTQRRSPIGKGARGKYWQFELECSSEFDYDTMNVEVAETARRI